MKDCLKFSLYFKNFNFILSLKNASLVKYNFLKNLPPLLPLLLLGAKAEALKESLAPYYDIPSPAY